MGQEAEGRRALASRIRRNLAAAVLMVSGRGRLDEAEELLFPTTTSTRQAPSREERVPPSGEPRREEKLLMLERLAVLVEDAWLADRMLRRIWRTALLWCSQSRLAEAGSALEQGLLHAGSPGRPY